MRSVTFYNFLLEATLTGSILILLLLLARVTIGKRISRLAVYAAWLLVAVRLLLPFSFPNPLMNELRPRLSGNYAAGNPHGPDRKSMLFPWRDSTWWQCSESPY